MNFVSDTEENEPPPIQDEDLFWSSQKSTSAYWWSGA
jgi:hypothetical protein